MAIGESNEAKCTHLDEHPEVFQVPSLRLDELDERVIALLVELHAVRLLLGLDECCVRVGDEQIRVVGERIAVL